MHYSLKVQLLSKITLLLSPTLTKHLHYLTGVEIEKGACWFNKLPDSGSGVEAIFTDDILTCHSRTICIPQLCSRGLILTHPPTLNKQAES